MYRVSAYDEAGDYRATFSLTYKAMCNLLGSGYLKYKEYRDENAPDMKWHGVVESCYVQYEDVGIRINLDEGWVLSVEEKVKNKKAWFNFS